MLGRHDLPYERLSGGPRFTVQDRPRLINHTLHEIDRKLILDTDVYRPHDDHVFAARCISSFILPS